MSDKRIEITCWRSGRVLFAHEAEHNTMRLTVEAAVKAGVDLSGADLYDANLAGSCLYDENDEKITLVGSRPIFQIGPIGSGSRYLIAFLTDQGLRLRTGCFFGTREQFEAKLADTHGDNEHAEEYRAALALIEAHERLWMPDEEASNAAIAKTIGQEGEQ